MFVFIISFKLFDRATDGAETGLRRGAEGVGLVGTEVGTRALGVVGRLGGPVKGTDGGAWWAAVRGVARSRTRLSNFTFTFHFHFSLSCIGEGNGNPLQCSCLENPRDRGAWWAAVYGVTQSRT